MSLRGLSARDVTLLVAGALLAAFAIVASSLWTPIDQVQPTNVVVASTRIEGGALDSTREVLARPESASLSECLDVQSRHIAESPGSKASRRREVMRIGSDVATVEWEGNIRRLRFASGALRAEEVLIDGKLDGPSTSWYEDGTLRAFGTYREGRPEGPWVYYSESARAMAEGSFVDGARDGGWTTWASTGQIESKGVYSNGKKIGNWRFWDIVTGELDESRSGHYVDDVRQSGDTR
jgi:hypothetical protein